jgi:hypothetical protein
MMSKEPQPSLSFLARKYPDGMSLDDDKFYDDATSIRTEADIRAFKKNRDTFEEQKYRNRMYRYLRGELSEIYSAGGYFEYPVPSVPELLEKARGWTANRLQQEIEGTCDVQIEKIQEAKKIAADTYTREKLEDCLWNRRPVTITLPSGNRMNHITSLEEVEELVGLGKDVQYVFDYWLAYYEELKAGYERLRKKVEAAAAKEEVANDSTVQKIQRFFKPS